MFLDPVLAVMEPENRHRRHHLILHTCEVSSRGELSSQLLNDSIPPP